MENKQMLEEFLELVQIPVNSRNERQIADVLKAKLEALGWKLRKKTPVPKSAVMPAI